MLRKGLPRAFPGLEEVKEKSRKEGTQYRSRVFQASPILMQGNNGGGMRGGTGREEIKSMRTDGRVSAGFHRGSGEGSV